MPTTIPEEALLTSKSPPYAGIITFLNSEFTTDLNNVDLAVYGVPFDLSTFNRPGARFGPRSIREQSHYVGIFKECWPHSELLHEKVKLIDYGDINFLPGKTDHMLAMTEKTVGELAKHNIFTLGLGGDHLVTYPAIKALVAKHGPLSLIHFDAHTDTFSMPYLNHGSMFYYAAQEGLINTEHSVQIGIRTPIPSTPKLHVLTADKCLQMGSNAIIEQIKAIVGNRKCYISLDVDGMDPAYTGGTGTPVPGGLTSALQRSILWGLKGLNVVGADVVEVSPPYDPTAATALVAATVAVDLLYILADSKLQTDRN